MSRSKIVTVIVAAWACSIVSAVAQTGPCTEQTIKDTIAKPDAEYLNFVADDAYFYSTALKKPVVGKSEAKTVGVPAGPTRKNEKWDAKEPGRIVIDPTGDMAYEYGTEHASYDEKETGKHQDFIAAYLRVWRNVGGACKVAAAMFQPEH